MGRNAWLIIVAAGSVFMAILIALLAYVFRESWLQPKTMSGPLFIMDGNPPKHGLLGIDLVNTPTPLIIQKVIPGSGAHEAGLKPGDAILSIGSVQNPDFATVRSLVENTAPGEIVLVKISRGPDAIEFRVKLTSFTDLVRLRQKEEAGSSGP